MRVWVNTTTKHQALPLTIAYLVKGFFDQLHRINHGDKSLGELGATESGELEAVERLTEYADMVEQLWQERFAGTDEWGGVWDYDVTEPFGEAIATHLITEHELPDDTRAKQLLASIIENEAKAWADIDPGPQYQPAEAEDRAIARPYTPGVEKLIEARELLETGADSVTVFTGTTQIVYTQNDLPALRQKIMYSM